MARKSGYPYDAFMKHLISQNKSVITATTYASQVRRIVRACGVTATENTAFLQAISADDIEQFIQEQSKKSQTPFRRSWRVFSTFMDSEGLPLASAELCRGIEAIPTTIGKALQTLNDEPFAFRLLPSMKWTLHDNPKIVAKGRQLASQECYAILHQGQTSFLPKSALDIITQWAYGSSAPTSSDYLVPRSPGSRYAMPLVMMRKVAGII